MRHWSLVRPNAGARGRVVVYAIVFAIAFGVRAWWCLRVQAPTAAVWSDMAGYVQRAELLLAGETPAEPRILTIWPWGTHAIIAGELALFGRGSVIGIGLCHAVVGALAAPIASALTARFVRSCLAMLLSGLIVAVWHPHVVFSGYFLSEIWFASATLLATLFLVRVTERRKGSALFAGVFLAIAFVVRPQVVLTVAIVGGALVLARLFRQRVLPLSRGAVVALLLPLVIAIGFSSVRFYRLNGRWGVISSNEELQSLFGATDVARVEARWQAPAGGWWTWWFNPTTKGIATPATTEKFEGFITDSEILQRIKKRRLEGVTVPARIHRMMDNVLLLAVDNVPWPEKESTVPMRVALQEGYAKAVFGVLALALVGVASLRRHPAAGLLVAAQLLTIFLVGALYLGEARHRVPYDPLLIVVAVSGLATIRRGVRFLARTILRARQEAAESRAGREDATGDLTCCLADNSLVLARGLAIRPSVPRRIGRGDGAPVPAGAGAATAKGNDCTGTPAKEHTNDLASGASSGERNEPEPAALARGRLQEG